MTPSFCPPGGHNCQNYYDSPKDNRINNGKVVADSAEITSRELESKLSEKVLTDCNSCWEVKAEEEGKRQKIPVADLEKDRVVSTDKSITATTLKWTML